MSWIKNLLIGLSIFLLTLVVSSNIIVSNLTQKSFPSIHNKLTYSRVHAFLAPDIQDNNSIDQNILFVGDSYTQGAGDSFLNGDYDYSVAHRVASDNINVVNTGVGGAGNVSSVINAIEMRNVSSSSLFLKEFPNFNKVVFFFYEGNDLNNNISSLKNYNGFNNIAKRLNQAEYMPLYKEFFHGYLYGLDFFRLNIKRYIKELVGKEVYNSIKSLFGVKNIYTHAINNKPNLVEYKNKSFLVTELQGPAMELTSKQLNESILIFQKSLERLKESFPNSEIEVVYIPSVATIVGKYINNKIKTQKYQELGSDLFTYDEIQKKSDRIKEKIKNTSLMLNSGFVDTTQLLIQNMNKSFLYGPMDMKHLNRYGYDSIYESLILNKTLAL